MLVAALIFVISMAAMIQFAVFTWRARLLRTASEELSCESGSTVESTFKLLQSQDFRDIYACEELCPQLATQDASCLRSVQLYYRFLRFLAALCDANLTKGSSLDWIQREIALCARYATVVLSNRLERNRALLAELNSF